LKCYKELLTQYKQRSDFVHDGTRSGINDEDILFLRDCVRKSILKYLEMDLNKADVISTLRKEISESNYWSR